MPEKWRARCLRFRERALRANLGSRFSCASSARESSCFAYPGLTPWAKLCRPAGAGLVALLCNLAIRYTTWVTPGRRKIPPRSALSG